MPPARRPCRPLRSLTLLFPLLLPLLLLLLLSPSLTSAQDVPLVFLDPPSLPRMYLFPSNFTAPFPTSPTPFTVHPPPASNPYGCPSSPSLPTYPPSSLALLHRGPSSSPCTFSDKALAASLAGAALLVVIDSPTSPALGMAGSSPPSSQSLLSALISSPDGAALLPLAGQQVQVRKYVRPLWDVSFGLMFALALAVLVGGAWLSAAKERRVQGGGGGAYGVDDGTGEAPAYMDWAAASCFVVVASCALVTLYFLMRYLVYALIGVFALMGAAALTALLSLAWGHWAPAYDAVVYSDAGVGRVRASTLVSAVVAVSMAVTWAVYRNAGWAWLLQDVLGAALLLQLQRATRLGSLQVAAVLLSLAFVYDVFWVFVSPLLFSGQSVMVAVATGGGTGEVVPMVLRLPRLQDEMAGVTILGLGDVALPGLLVSLLLRFDYHLGLGWARGYFMPVVVGYAVGLGLTYVAMAAMRKGQPALLYLVPCTLYFVLALAGWRGDLRALWEGSEEEAKEERMSNARLQGGASRPSAASEGEAVNGTLRGGRATAEGMTASLLRRDSADSASEDSSV